MNIIKGQTFELTHLRSETPEISGLSVRDCRFDNCSIGPGDADKRPIVVNCEFRSCRSFNSHIGAVALVDVVVDDYRANALTILWYPTFRRVTLRGKITSLKINSRYDAVCYSEQKQRQFEEEAESFYAQTDWALDITDAKMSTFELEGIPTHLIRHDTRYGLVVHRDSASDPAWRAKIAPWNTHWLMRIDFFLAGDEPSVLLVAPYGKKKLRDGLTNLRDIGLA